MPLRILYKRPGLTFAIVASALWGVTTVLEKMAIEHTKPENGPFVALSSTVLVVIILTPGAILSLIKIDKSSIVEGKATTKVRSGGLLRYPYVFCLAVIIAGIAPLFGFTAIALGLVGYVTAIFKLGAVLTVLWATLFLKESGLKERLLGAGIMVFGTILIIS